MSDTDAEFAELQEEIRKTLYADHFATIDEVAYLLGSSEALARRYRAERDRLREVVEAAFRTIERAQFKGAACDVCAETYRVLGDESIAPVPDPSVGSQLDVSGVIGGPEIGSEMADDEAVVINGVSFTIGQLAKIANDAGFILRVMPGSESSAGSASTREGEGEDPVLRASLERGMAQAAAGEVVDRGSFEPYLDDDEFPAGGAHVTRSGTVLTDADIEALSDEAEQGYDVSHLTSNDIRLGQLRAFIGRVLRHHNVPDERIVLSDIMRAFGSPPHAASGLDAGRQDEDEADVAHGYVGYAAKCPSCGMLKYGCVGLRLTIGNACCPECPPEHDLQPGDVGHQDEVGIPDDMGEASPTVSPKLSSDDAPPGPSQGDEPQVAEP